MLFNGYKDLVWVCRQTQESLIVILISEKVCSSLAHLFDWRVWMLQSFQFFDVILWDFFRFLFGICKSIFDFLREVIDIVYCRLFPIEISKSWLANGLIVGIVVFPDLLEFFCSFRRFHFSRHASTLSFLCISGISDLKKPLGKCCSSRCFFGNFLRKKFWSSLTALCYIGLIFIHVLNIEFKDLFVEIRLFHKFQGGWPILLVT